VGTQFIIKNLAMMPRIPAELIPEVFGSGTSAAGIADGSGLRDYVHVWDLAAAHVATLFRFDALPGSSTAINLGTGTSTVRELLAAFNRVADRPIEALEADRRPG